MKKTNSTHQRSVQSAVDHLLLVFVVLSALTGFILDSCNAVSRSAWLWTHIAAAVGFTALSGIHFWQHWGWFRTLPKRLGARKKDSLLLLVALFVLLLTGALMVTAGKTHVSGFAHCVFGILCLVVSLYHFYVRHVRGKRH